MQQFVEVEAFSPDLAVVRALFLLVCSLVPFIIGSDLMLKLPKNLSKCDLCQPRCQVHAGYRLVTVDRGADFRLFLREAMRIWGYIFLHTFSVRCFSYSVFHHMRYAILEEEGSCR